ncbi:MAG TPA: helix-turn-helix domain-containing protein [Candidatus Nanoarchaeia archaeon]|nr:helix-turn-helix domain-containing protein [Candidatus Nanoarchaeia archaeon]
MDTNVLKGLGLTDNEVKVYLSVLRLGACSGTEIRKNTKISNSQVYAALDTLIEKGLISYEKRASGRRYTALDPSVIKTILEKRNKVLEDSIPYLKSLQNRNISSTDTAIFEGLHGFKNAMLNLAEECPNNEIIYIIGFSNQAYKNKQLADILRDVNKISKQKKHKFKMILDNRENKFFEQRSKEGFSEIKFMQRGFKSPAAIDIFKDFVYILLWDEHPYAIRIKNKNIAEGFRTYFDFLWNIAKK